MCTVLFIPQKNNILFVSIRDENPKRASALPANKYVTPEHEFIYPVDTKANGTWVGVTSFNQVIILLNGGFVKHTTGKQYRVSRGLIVKELLYSETALIDWHIMNLDGIEPFTLVVYANQKLFRLVWDGAIKHKINLKEDEAHLFSSSTLYNSTQQQQRLQRWQQFYTQQKQQITANSLLSFFNSINDADNGFYMHRNESIQSLSCSIIKLNNNSTQYLYTNLVTQQTQLLQINRKHYVANCNL